MDFHGVTVDPLSVSVRDRDVRGVAISHVALAVNEGHSADYTVVLETAPTDAVTVSMSLSGNAVPDASSADPDIHYQQLGCAADGHRQCWTGRRCDQ